MFAASGFHPPSLHSPARSAQVSNISSPNAVQAKPVIIPAVSEQIQIAKTLWVMKACSEYWSFTSSEGIGDLFKKIVPGPVSNGFKMGWMKST